MTTKVTRPIRCDACCKPLKRNAAGVCLFATDERICGNTDGPGFYLCERVKCESARLSRECFGGLEDLRAYYTEGRARNNKRRKLGRPRRSAAPTVTTIAFGVTEAERASIVAAAEEAKLTPGQYARAAALESAALANKALHND